MALKVNKLTDRGVRSFKKEGYYSDGDGLYLVVARTGGRSWIYRYRSGGARRDMGLGSFLDVSLREAGEARDDVKRIIADGRDPLEWVRPAAMSPTSSEAALAVMRRRSAGSVLERLCEGPGGCGAVARPRPVGCAPPRAMRQPSRASGPPGEFLKSATPASSAWVGWTSY